MELVLEEVNNEVVQLLEETEDYEVGLPLEEMEMAVLVLVVRWGCGVVQPWEGMEKYGVEPLLEGMENYEEVSHLGGGVYGGLIWGGGRGKTGKL